MLLDCKLSKDAISSMLLGSMPKVDNLTKIADYIGCSIDYLIGRSDIPNNPNLKLEVKEKSECVV